jgi:serine/threonine protein kinase
MHSDSLTTTHPTGSPADGEAATRRSSPASLSVRARIAGHQTRALLTGDRTPYLIGGKYRLRTDVGDRGFLGEGGMGCVYAVHHDGLNRLCVAKFMLAAAVGACIDRFHREAEILARVPHPNIVQVYDSGFDGEDLFIIMEYVEGQDLVAWLDRPRPWRDVVDVFLHAGRGLAEAHAQGVVHRDFTPRNVRIFEPNDTPVPAEQTPMPDHLRPTEPDMRGRPHDTEPPRRVSRSTTLATRRIATSRQVRVIDFGIAGEGVAPDGDDAASPPQVVAATRGRIGTPGYMSPEQIHREAASALSDQFSFCACLYEALYRRRPFGDLDGRSQTFSAQLTVYEQRVASGELRVPEARGPHRRLFTRVLRRGLHRDPRLRFPSMAALLAELERELGRARRIFTTSALTGLVAGAVVLGALLGPEPDDPYARCETSAADAPLLDANRRAAVEQHVHDPSLRGRLVDRLESFDAAWQRRNLALCRSAAAGAAPSAVLAERACLDHHHAVVRGVLDRLAATELRSTVTLAELPDDAQLADCAADQRYARDPARRRSWAQLDDLLARAEAALVLGDYADARSLADAAVDIAAAEPDSSQHALALYQRARAETYDPDPSAARATLERAALLAEAHHLPGLAADIQVRLMRVTSSPEARRVHADNLRGKLAELRAVNDPREADARRMLIADALDRRDFASAERQLAELAPFDSRGGPFARGRTADLHGNLALERRQYAAAQGHFRRTLELQIAELGERHDKHAITLRKLAIAHYRAGELDAATAAIARADEMPVAQQPILAAEVLAARFDIEVAAGRDAEARATGEAARDLYLQLPGDHAGRAGELHLLGHLVRFACLTEDVEATRRAASLLAQRFSAEDDAKLPGFALHFGNAAMCTSDFADDDLAERLLGRLPPDRICEEPDVCIVAASLALRRGRSAEALALAARAADRTRDNDDSDSREIFEESRRIYTAARQHFTPKRGAKRP